MSTKNTTKKERFWEDNGDARIKRQFMGRKVVVAITRQTEFWPLGEQIFYAELDGRRRKRALIKIIGA